MSHWFRYLPSHYFHFPKWSTCEGRKGCEQRGWLCGRCEYKTRTRGADTETRVCRGRFRRRPCGGWRGPATWPGGPGEPAHERFAPPTGSGRACAQGHAASDVGGSRGLRGEPGSLLVLAPHAPRDARLALRAPPAASGLFGQACVETPWGWGWA